MIAPMFSFPCRPNKKPLTAHGFFDAKREQSWEGWPLVGYPTGAANGVDVLDIDRRRGGEDWYTQNFDALPLTLTYETQSGGLHLLFKAAPGLRCSSDRIAPGVDVRAEGGYAIFWPRQGLPFEVHPICEWADWLLKSAMPFERNRSTAAAAAHGPLVAGTLAANLTEALFKLDPVAWRGDHDGWLELMMGCKFAGISQQDFISWSVGDPVYAGDAEVIARKWASIAPKHAGALFAALKQAGIKLSHHGERAAVPLKGPTRNPRRLSAAIQRSVECAQGNDREPSLFRAACSMAEVVGEKKLQQDVAAGLLESAARSCGLWSELGPEGCRRTIMNGFRHIELKLQQRTET